MHDTTAVGSVLSLADDFLAEDERNLVDHNLRHGAWKFGWKSRSREDAFAFWHLHFAGYRKGGTHPEAYPCAEELKETSQVMFAFWQVLSEKVLKGHTLYRCYANAQSYGSDGTVHTDSSSSRSVTTIYYPHAVWKPDWAGETVLFNGDRSDIVATIYPRPNRLATFPGNTPHVARGVSRICPMLRIVLVFKTEA